ncbi:hypothetical protein MP228_009819 [Amoeboaphelidium protococcarum]|nr:hypothetical protein MP228_009819 [Amoeboaphelidium protococcarum]
MKEDIKKQEEICTNEEISSARTHRYVAADSVRVHRHDSSSMSSTAASQSQSMSKESISFFEWTQGQEEYIASMLRHVHDKQSQSQQLAQVDAILKCIQTVAEIGSKQRCDLSEEEQNKYLSQVSEKKNQKYTDNKTVVARENELDGPQDLVHSILKSCMSEAQLQEWQWFKNSLFDQKSFEKPLSPLTLRVYGRILAKPDFMLSLRSDIGQIELVGPMVEVKRDLSIALRNSNQSLSARSQSSSGSNSKRQKIQEEEEDIPSEQFKNEYVCQATNQGVCFMQRVFPMLSIEQVNKIFGEDWFVYVPLMSHRQLSIVRVDALKIGSSKCVSAYYTRPCTGRDMAYLLNAWFQWAVSVFGQLIKVKDKINANKFISCWVPPQSIVDACFKYKVDVKKLQPMPSFYNPLYKYDNETVFKFYNWWTLNSSGLEIVNMVVNLRDLNLLWHQAYRLIVMPVYHGDLSSHPPTSALELVCVLKQVVKQLIIIMNALQICHCDLRPQNVCWKTAAMEDVVLIDYDLATVTESPVPKRKSARDIGPEDIVGKNHDMWAFGVMVLQLTTLPLDGQSRHSFNWDWVTDRRDQLRLDPQYLPNENLDDHFKLKDVFEPHKDKLLKLVEMCLQSDKFRCHLSGGDQSMSQFLDDWEAELKSSKN